MGSGWRTSPKAHSRPFSSGVRDGDNRSDLAHGGGERMEIGTRVELVTFDGAGVAPPDHLASENYWLLLGQRGRVIGVSEQLSRLLVRFDCAVERFGLHCHNPEPDSLYILASDLRTVGDDPCDGPPSR